MTSEHGNQGGGQGGPGEGGGGHGGGEGPGHPRDITYSVNGEAQHTTEHKLTVRQVLENAELTPATDYKLTRDNGNHTFTDYDEEIPLHDGESFTATFIGQTPTS